MNPDNDRIPVWLDCDPGHDDAMAIVLAGWNPRLRLLGISTVASNQTVDKTTQNALDVLEWAGLGSIDVVAGAAKPLLRPMLICPEIHGNSGLDGPWGGPVLPRSTRTAVAGKAVNRMFDCIAREAARAPGGRVSLVCTGALTNAAALFIVYPEAVGLVEVTIMGGALGVGNTGPVQEFNIQVDPEAAKVVFDSGVPLTMVPLEVTHTALVTPSVLERIMTADSLPAGAIADSLPSGTAAPSALDAAVAAAALGAAPTAAALDAAAACPPSPAAGDCGASAPLLPHAPAAASAAADGGGVLSPSPFKALVSQLLTFFASTYREVFKFEHPPLHDPVAVAAVIAPAIFTFEDMRVDIETSSPLCAGQTVCDIWHVSERPHNCRVARTVDVATFWDLMVDALDRADAASPMHQLLRTNSSGSISSSSSGSCADPSAGVGHNRLDTLETSL